MVPVFSSDLRPEAVTDFGSHHVDFVPHSPDPAEIEAGVRLMIASHGAVPGERYRLPGPTGVLSLQQVIFPSHQT